MLKKANGKNSGLNQEQFEMQKIYWMYICFAYSIEDLGYQNRLISQRFVEVVEEKMHSPKYG